MSSTLAQKHILLGLTGGIACYKAAELCRLLMKAGASVQVVLTESAEHFVGKATFQALSGRRVVSCIWDEEIDSGMAHIDLGREADAIVVAPASLDFMARLSSGHCNDLLSLICVARPRDRVPLLIAPAMNREMWSYPATERAVQQLKADGVHVLDVAEGSQACGETGPGRMLEPEAIVDALRAHFSQQPLLLSNKHVLITAGPTFEAIDPVRGITNHSSGKTGFAIAAVAKAAGANTTLIAGPVHLDTPTGVTRVDVTSAQEMDDAVQARIAEADIFIATAAVADWRVAKPSAQKMKSDKTASMTLNLIPNPDILARVAASERAQSKALFCVGFAAETHDLAEKAKAKRATKHVPLLVANLGPATFGQEVSEWLLVDACDTLTLPRRSKSELAQLLIEEIAKRIAS